MVCSFAIAKLFKTYEKIIYRAEYAYLKIIDFRLWFQQCLRICDGGLENRYWKGNIWKEK